MSVYSHVGDLPAGTAWVIHRPCGAGYRVEDADDGWGKLVCEACESNELGTGYGTFTAHKYPPASEVMGGKPYVPVPRWILRGEEPALTRVERAVVLTLWGHEFGNTYAEPSIEKLAEETGFSDSAVKGALRQLIKRGLITREPSAGRHPSRYSVADLIRGDLRTGATNPADSAPQPGRQRRVNPADSAPEVEEESEKENPSIEGVARQARDAPSSTSADRPPRCDEGEQLPERPAVPVEGVAAVEPVQDVHDPTLLQERPAVPNTEPVEAAVERLVGPVPAVEGGLDGGLRAAGGGAGSAGGGATGGLVHGDGSLGTGNGNGHVTERPGVYVGGECPNPLHCRYWKRFPSGPWTCEYNHPRVPRAVR